MNESLIIKILTVTAAAVCIGTKLANCLEGKCRPLALAYGRPKIQSQGTLVRFRCFKGYELVGRRYMNCFKGQWDFERDISINYPVCVKPGCRASSYVNGHFLETYRGAVVRVVCNLGYTLNGPSTVYCNGYQWNRPFPKCRVMNPNPPKYCDFQTDLCEWTQDPEGAWIRKNDSNFYMAVANSSYRIRNTGERLFSPVFPSTYANDSCFTFKYRLHAKNSGYLKVYVKQEGGELDNTIPSFWVSGDQGPDWLPGYFELYPTNVSFQIIIEGVSIPGNASETAFDDVKIQSGADCKNFKLYYLSHQSLVSTTAETLFEDDSDSCRNRCGNTTSEVKQKCECEESCLKEQTCCSDFEIFCRTTTSTETATSSSTAKEVTDETEEVIKTSSLSSDEVSSKKISTSTTRKSSTVKKSATTTASPRRRVNHLNLQTHVDPSISVQMTKSRLDEMTKDKIYGAGGDNPQLMKSEGEKFKSPSGIFPSGTMEGIVAVVAILICTASVVAFIRRRRRKKTEKESMVEDSDVRFLTSDELLDFTLARPADDDL